MNLEVYILGTSGMMPLPNRFLTSVLIRREGELMLFDCGEGTQVSLKKLNLKWKKISRIFISHMHADHVTGLPGMLMLSSQVDRIEPLHIYGPAKIKEYIDANRTILDMYINYEIIVHPVEPGTVCQGEGFTIEAFRLNHTKPCMGYSLIEEDRPGRFFPEKAHALKIPVGPLWAKLQNGESITLEDGTEISPEMVLGERRKGRKFTFITDTAYDPQYSKFAADADLLICEGMFDSSLEESAADKKHLTSQQAGRLARHAEQVKQMGLIHYSPRYTDRELSKLLHEARDEFPSTFLCRDQMYIDIPYEE